MLRSSSREAGFSAQFYVLAEKGTLNNSGLHFFSVTKKEQTGTYTASQHGLGTCEWSLIIKGVPALVSQEEGHLIFIFNMDILDF